MKDELLKLVERASNSERVRKTVHVARIAIQTGPVKELATICGRAGAAGAIVDGGMGAFQAVNAVRKGEATPTEGAKHAAAEAGCGFVTSASGTAGTLAIYMMTGAMGPAALAAGMGASMGSRWAYRKIVGETLPGKEAKETNEYKKEESSNDDDFESIGPN